MQNYMYSRSINWYIGIIFLYLLLFNINISAKDICNETNQEQVISNGENQQYIPPHKCVTIADDEKYKISDTVTSEEPEEVIKVIETSEVKESEEVEVKKVNETKEVEESVDEPVEDIATTEVIEEEKEHKVIIYIVVAVVIIFVIKGGYREKN